MASQINSSANAAAAGPPLTEDQQLLIFLKDLNLNVSQMKQNGQANEVDQILTAANMDVQTLLAILNTHTSAQTEENS